MSDSERKVCFGGPAGQIAVLHRILVEEKRWIQSNGFCRVLAFYERHGLLGHVPTTSV